MNRGKRLIAVLTCMILCLSTLAGCSSDSKPTTSDKEKENTNEKGVTSEVAEKLTADKTAVNLGCYVEEEIEGPAYADSELGQYFYADSEKHPKMISSQYIDTSGKSSDEQNQEAASADDFKTLYYTHTLKDGAWEKKELPGLDAIDSTQYINDLIEYSDGKYYAVCNKYNDDSNGESSSVTTFLYEYNEKTKELKDISPVKWIDNNSADSDENQWWGPENLRVNADGVVFYLTSGNQIHIYKPQTKESNTIDCIEGYGQFEVSGKKLYYRCWDKIQVYDIDTLKEEDPIATAEFSGTNLLLTNDGDLYLSGEAGIQHWNKDKSTWDNIIKGKDSVLGLQENFTLTNVVGIDGEHDEFYIGSRSAERKMVHIYFDPNASNTKEKKLTIYSLTEIECIKNAVTKYQQSNKDVDVEYVVGLQDSDILIEDELKRVNSELLAGNGADIYILNGLPAEDFMDKGVLADISYLLKPYIEQGELFDNMVKYYTQESGAMYQYPMKIIVPISIYSSIVTQDNPGLEELNQMTESNEKVELAIGNTPLALMVSSLLEYSGEWITSEHKLDINQWKSYAQSLLNLKGKLLDEAEGIDAYNTVDYKQLYYDPFYWVSGDNAGVLTGSCLRCDEMIYNLSNFIKLQAYIDRFQCHYSTVNNCFSPIALFGMNQNCKNREQAEAFIRSLFTLDYQQETFATSLPVTKTALKSMIMPEKETLQKQSFGFGYGTDGVIDLQGSEIRYDFLQEIYDMICNLDHPVMQDTKLLVMLAQKTAEVLDGTVTLDEAAKELDNLVSLQLAE